VQLVVTKLTSHPSPAAVAIALHLRLFVHANDYFLFLFSSTIMLLNLPTHVIHIEMSLYSPQINIYPTHSVSS
jgi:hypothetical protein